jgi:SnoaL-like domain
MSTATTSYADVVAGVRAALAAYTHALDDGRTDDVVATFCTDGTFEGPGLGTHEGHEALRAWFGSVEPRQPQRHVVVNTHVDTWTAQEATATSDLIFLLMGDKGWSVQLVGRYRDHLHHDEESGAWRFHRRSARFVTETT